MGLKMPEVGERGLSSSKEKTKRVIQGLGANTADKEEEQVKELSDPEKQLVDNKITAEPEDVVKHASTRKRPKVRLAVTVDAEINDFLDSLAAKSRHGNKSLIVNDILGDYMDNYIKEQEK